MLITGSLDKIRFVLSSSVATSQLTFTANYNNYTTSSVSLLTSNGTSSNTTPVDIIPSPSSNQQNELRYCSIYNPDTANSTVYIQTFDGTNARRVFQAVLGSGDILQYQQEKGWEVLDTLGEKRNYGLQTISPTVRGTTGWRPAGIATSAAFTTQVNYIVPLGRADRSYTSIDFMYNVTTALSGSVTWAEMAVYAGPKVQPEGGFILPYRAGFTNVNVNSPSGWLTTTGVKKTTVATTGIKQGDLLFMVMGAASTIMPQMRTHAWGPTNLTEFLFGSNTGVNNSTRPSTTPNFTYAALNVTQWWVLWQGN
jgi:hypothetical protein